MSDWGDEPLPQIQVSSEVSDELSLLLECRESRRTVARSWMRMMESNQDVQDAENVEDADRMEKELEILTEDIEKLQNIDGQIQRLLSGQDVDEDMEESNELLCQLQNFKNNCLIFLDDQSAPVDEYSSDCSDDEPLFIIWQYKSSFDHLIVSTRASRSIIYITARYPGNWAWHPQLPSKEMSKAGKVDANPQKSKRTVRRQQEVVVIVWHGRNFN